MKNISLAKENIGYSKSNLHPKVMMGKLVPIANGLNLLPLIAILTYI
jgi:hypothetical protein